MFYSLRNVTKKNNCKGRQYISLSSFEGIITNDRGEKNNSF